MSDVIVRHKTLARATHWSVAISFFVCVFTGMPIWSPVFGWMAHFFGGLENCRWLHPLAGVAFFATSLAMFLGWIGEMLRPGKYNFGQRAFFYAVSAGAIALIATGVILWFPMSFAQPLRELSLVLHDFTFIAFAVGIIGHMYLGTVGEPGTFESMTRGTVTKKWARFHHPLWYREVTGEEDR